MNKKILVVIAFALVAGVGFMFLSGKYFQKARYEMIGGTIKEVKNGSIVVDGSVRSLDPKNSSQERKTIEFIITSRTILKKSTISATIDQMKSGKPFHPETKITAGNISDLIIGMGIFKIESKDNLFSADKATAAEINYITHDFPLL